MAEVLAPISPQTSTITMLHSSAEAYQNNSNNQGHSQPSRHTQMPRSHLYNNVSNGVSANRGPSTTPVAPYAFQTTPHLRHENRTASSPGNPYGSLAHANSSVTKLGQTSSPSVSTVSSTSSSRSSLPSQAASKDDSIIPTPRQKVNSNVRPASAVVLSPSAPEMRVPSSDANAKPSPGRYRRTPSRVDSNNSITPVSPGVPHGTEKQLFMQDGPSLASTLSIQPRSQSGNDPGYIAHIPQKSTDANNRGSPAHSRNGSADASQRAAAEQASRYRRRSVGAFEPGQTPGATASASAATTFSGTSYASAARPDGQSQRPMANNMHPSSAHQRQGSSESVSSGNRSRPSSVSHTIPISRVLQPG